MSRIDFKNRRIGFLQSGLLGLSVCLGTAAADEVDFAREVLPVLSNKCFVCHGPDTHKKNFLRLDSFEAATEDRGGYRAIDPEKPEASEVLIRIHDADDPMPPEDAEKQLTEAEREILGQWIKQGGGYAKHWAFVPPVKPALPTDALGSVEGGIDAFIQAQLQADEIEFAPEAEKSVLARRAALVLTGLPPEPEQLARFLADDQPNAYSQYVDELLASPRYGEHQARYWLDAVRYGDTHGLHLDNRRGIFPYRDWVVKALNDNLPFDTFIEWQLAGDLHPDPSLEQLLATGFVRMNPTTAEGGAIPLEFQAKNNFDRTETFGTVFLGMTFTCARCHTHKYDPITQTEYYRLFAFFNSTSEKSMDGNAYEYAPVLKVPSNPAAWPGWSRQLARRDALLKQVGLGADDVAESVLEYATGLGDWKAENWERTTTSESGEETWEEAKGLPGRIRRSRLPDKGESVGVRFQVETPDSQTLWLHFAGSDASAVQLNGDDLEVAYLRRDGRQRGFVGLNVQSGTNQIHIRLVGNGDAGEIEVRLEQPWDRVAKAKGLKTSDPANRLLLVADPKGPWSDKPVATRARSMAVEMMSEASTFTTSLVASDLEEPRETRVLRRGEYNLPIGDRLKPGVPAVMGSLPAELPRNRLGLAQWLTAREHPLVTRVLMNRIWQRTFGYGLVRSPEDFGLQGQYPTHPALLDWLAVEFQDSGWDLKHMLRLMVNSRAFRQKSEWRNDVSDPENRLYARGPSHRLDAEVLRDLGLWAAGILDPHMGGEGVKPYQPSGLWKALAHPASNTKQYVRDEGELLYRRSLYVYWKRTSPHPMMMLFDAPSRESSCVRRSRTNTPLQSLGLLNETQRIEMGRLLGERVLETEAQDGDRLDLMFSLLACREPDPREREACLQLLHTMRERYQADPAAAEALLKVGELRGNATLNPVERASWSQVATAVLASDAAILLY